SRELSERFRRGGTLIATGETPQDWSDARHVAVEFVHPVIVGKRALPALALPLGQVPLLASSDDPVIRFRGGPLSVGEWSFAPPTDDPFIRQELIETLYHVLWETVHVFLEHAGSSVAGAGSSSFLYPFLERSGGGGDEVEADVARSVLVKAREVGELRERTVGDGAAIEAAAAVVAAGGKVLAFGNGGSATDAVDLVADLRSAGLQAIDLTDDSAILTALANDVGPEVLFQRQLIAHGREGDVAVAFSTSGGSSNILLALEEARRRGLQTVAIVGYDGGRIAAEGLADHVILAPSE